MLTMMFHLSIAGSCYKFPEVGRESEGELDREKKYFDISYENTVN